MITQDITRLIALLIILRRLFMNDRLKKQMNFILEIDKLKAVKRQTYLSDGVNKENDAEHSWHLAMMCLLLNEYANEKIDVLKTMSMVLIHDIIEIDAGDTYAYDEAGNQTKSEREKKAADRLFNILPEDQADMMMKLWREFEERKTPEAKFASAVDRVQPTMLNDASGGKSWKEHSVKVSSIINRNSVSSEGSKELWDYAMYNYVKPNVNKGNIYNDIEDIDMTRFELSYMRIAQIREDINEKNYIYVPYFKEMTEVLYTYYRCLKWVEELSRKYYGQPVKWYKEVSLEEWKSWNEAVNVFRYDKEYYNTSYANPDNAVRDFGVEIGRVLSSVAASICSLGSRCFEQRYFEFVIYAELLLELYEICGNESESSHYGAMKSALYYHVYDYMEEITGDRIMKSLDTRSDIFTNIVKYMDLTDIRSLYLYGENVSDNELSSFKYINSLPQAEIDKIAGAYVNGYIKSFELEGIDLSKKETVQIRFPLGFERIIKRAIELFDANNLKPLILRGKNQSGCIDTNPQFAYDHRQDDALVFNKAVKERKMAVTRKAYDTYKREAAVYAGPAVLEYFGEETFTPVPKESAVKYDEEQQKLNVSQRIEMANLVNEYIKKDSYSFTIIAFPLPSIGKRYEDIFKECIKINTLDTELFEKIQGNIIYVLDRADKVHIQGNNGNVTDLYIKLAKINDYDKETCFHNCLADCNIPVGEVYTSPVLEGTEGILNVNKVYINGLEYRNLMIEFKDGMTGDYNCSNYDDEKKNKDFVRDNLMNQYESLPMGEFAVGTNTAAYKLGRDYGIADKLPILIAEKTGPHIAIGDTCFSMSEELKVYNPDGKEMIAKDNSVSLNRKTDINKAYKGCHTDITIPYDELGKLSAIDYDGNETIIIENGRFVLEGTTELNTMM